jgi:hypothetical protein
VQNNNVSLTEQFSNSANEFWETVGGYLPNLFSAILLLVLALVVARLVQAAVVKLLEVIGVSKLAKNKQVAKTLRTAEVNVDFISIAGRIAFWVVIVIFALTIADVLGLTAMRDVIRELLGYLPSVLAAVVVLTVTVAGARLLRDVLQASLYRLNVDYARNIAQIAFYVLTLFGTLMAVDQLGFDTTILTANITIIVSGVMLALALAFGLGGKDVAGRIVEDSFRHFQHSNKKRK